MTLSFPTTDVAPLLYASGAGKMYTGPYVANGADIGSPVFLGATLGGVGFHVNPSQHHIESDQYLTSLASIRIKNEVMVKAVFQQMNLAAIYQLIGRPTDVTLSGGAVGDTGSSLSLSDNQVTTYMQLLFKGYAPPGATNSTRVIQLWRAVVHQIAEIKLEKTKESAVGVTWMCHADPTAVAALGANFAVGKIIDS